MVSARLVLNTCVSVGVEERGWGENIYYIAGTEPRGDAKVPRPGQSRNPRSRDPDQTFRLGLKARILLSRLRSEGHNFGPDRSQSQNIGLGLEEDSDGSGT